jgi:hypothetical protein
VPFPGEYSCVTLSELLGDHSYERKSPPYPSPPRLMKMVSFDNSLSDGSSPAPTRLVEGAMAGPLHEVKSRNSAGGMTKLWCIRQECRAAADCTIGRQISFATCANLAPQALIRMGSRCAGNELPSKVCGCRGVTPLPAGGRKHPCYRLGFGFSATSSAPTSTQWTPFTSGRRRQSRTASALAASRRPAARWASMVGRENS